MNRTLIVMQYDLPPEQERIMLFEDICKDQRQKMSAFKHILAEKEHFQD